MPDSPPPPQPSVFAVWRWKWWTWAALVPLAVAVYLISPVPILYFTLMLDPPDAVLTAEYYFTAPAWWIRAHTEAFEAIDQAQRKALYERFGVWLDNALDD